MKNQLLIAIAILFNSYCYGQQNAGGVTTEMLLQEPPLKEVVEAEVKRFRILSEAVQQKDVEIDPMTNAVWSNKANQIQKGLAAGKVNLGSPQFVSDFQTFAAFNRSIGRNVDDTDRIIVLECCHKIKDGKVCDSLSEQRKSDLKKCRNSTK